MAITGVFPARELRGRFERPLQITYLGLEDIARVTTLAGPSILDIGSHAWMRYVDSGVDVDPQMLAPFFNDGDPLLYLAVEEVMGAPVIYDLLYVQASIDDELDYTTTAKLVLAHAYPGELHIADVEFSDPYRPIPPAERRYTYQEFGGLGLFAPLIARIEAYGRDQGIETITLTAASPDQRTGPMSKAIRPGMS